MNNTIEERLDVVEYLINNADDADILKQNIKLIGDLERLISKVAVGKINPRELVQIKKALYSIETIKTECEKASNPALNKIAEQLNACQIIRDKIEKEINPEAPVMVNKGNVIAKGVNEELDELRMLAYSGKDYLVQVQQREIEKTGYLH